MEGAAASVGLLEPEPLFVVQLKIERKPVRGAVTACMAKRFTTPFA
jgi:hypothetical protein